jgi:hypothetical protein
MQMAVGKISDRNCFNSDNFFNSPLAFHCKNCVWGWEAVGLGARKRRIGRQRVTVEE